MKIKIIEIAYHRNGVSGMPFHAVLFKQGRDKFIASVFEEPKYISVICLDRLPHISVANDNAWRGDEYESVLREAIDRTYNYGKT